MQTVTTIGLDIAKSVFQVHGVDAAGQVVVRRQLKRRYVLAFFEKLPPCLIGIEACASSHHWSRELTGRSGTRCASMPPPRPYVKRRPGRYAVCGESQGRARAAGCSRPGHSPVDPPCPDPWYLSTGRWLTALLARRPTRLPPSRLPTRLPRMAWAMMAKGERYKEPVALAA